MHRILKSRGALQGVPAVVVGSTNRGAGENIRRSTNRCQMSSRTTFNSPWKSTLADSAAAAGSLSSMIAIGVLPAPKHGEHTESCCARTTERHLLIRFR